jgi:hypothetical protein
MTAEQKAEEYTNKNDTIVMGFEENLDCTDQMQQAFIDGYHEGFKDCAKSRLNVTTISDCPIKDEEESKYKTAYIKGIRTMANALRDYDKTDGAWTDYFEHTVEEVLNRLLKEIE